MKMFVLAALVVGFSLPTALVAQVLPLPTPAASAPDGPPGFFSEEWSTSLSTRRFNATTLPPLQIRSPNAIPLKPPPVAMRMRVIRPAEPVIARLRVAAPDPRVDFKMLMPREAKNSRAKPQR